MEGKVMITFTDDDYSSIASTLADYPDHFNVEHVLSDGTEITVFGDASWGTYQETDSICGYGNGTGAWINYGLSLSADFEAYDEDGNVIQGKTNFDETKLYNALADILDVAEIRHTPAKIQRAYKEAMCYY